MAELRMLAKEAENFDWNATRKNAPDKTMGYEY